MTISVMRRKKQPRHKPTKKPAIFKSVLLVFLYLEKVRNTYNVFFFFLFKKKLRHLHFVSMSFARSPKSHFKFLCYVYLFHFLWLLLVKKKKRRRRRNINPSVDCDSPCASGLNRSTFEREWTNAWMRVTPTSPGLNNVSPCKTICAAGSVLVILFSYFLSLSLSFSLLAFCHQRNFCFFRALRSCKSFVVSFFYYMIFFCSKVILPLVVAIADSAPLQSSRPHRLARFLLCNC